MQTWQHILYVRYNIHVRDIYKHSHTAKQSWIAVAGDKVKNIKYQDARDMVTLSIVSGIQHYDKQLGEVDKMLEKMYEMLGCTLTTIPGVNIITAVKLLSEIGDIKRFVNASSGKCWRKYVVKMANM